MHASLNRRAIVNQQLLAMMGFDRFVLGSNLIVSFSMFISSDLFRYHALILLRNIKSMHLPTFSLHYHGQ